MKEIKRLLPALGLVFLFGACSQESKQTQPVTTTTDKGSSTAPDARGAKQQDKALVRVIHAIPGTPAVDAYSGDTKIFPDVAYKSVTPYKELADNRQAFKVKPVGEDTNQPLAENSESFSGGKHYTLIAMPSNAKGETTLKVVNDDLVPPSSGKSRVRVINAAVGAGEVDVYSKVNQKNLFSGVNVESEVGYKEIDPMFSSLEIRPEEKGRPRVTIPVNFESDKTYTIVLLGRGPKLEAITVEDQLTSPPEVALR